MKMKKGWIWLIGVGSVVLVLTLVALVAPNLGNLKDMLVGNYASDGRGSEIALTMDESKPKDDYGTTASSPKMRQYADREEDALAMPGEAPTPSVTPSKGSGYVNADYKSMDGNYATNKMLIKNGTITIESDDPLKASQACTEVAIRYGGDILNSNTSLSDNNAYVTMTIRVPFGNFEKAINEIQKSGKVTSINTTADDVSKEFVDLQTRQTTIERLLKKLNSLLDNARNEEAMIQMYESIAQYEQELESVKGQMKYLQGMTSFSRITITISKPGEAVTYPISNDFTEALQVIWRAFLTAILWILVILVVGLPILGFILLVVWIVKMLIRSNRPRPQM
jgi:hypothetical protein